VWDGRPYRHVFGLCALFVLGVFVTMFVSFWSSRRTDPGSRVRQSLAFELVWTAIPSLMLVAAAGLIAVSLL
jgi:heme/copper-type cytochrome/quinol oxidase subunit 2